eukprot:TRINITY_DN8344_c0_g1_i1.p1 TRINITY_DN8344_c0_g1~~TRINITY_DN8344_c0_g1_i1.p1  ORF type:complete len:443 (-),score=110.55 TRINITY_DN8344_c0_g1_i1:201-1529(-)
MLVPDFQQVTFQLQRIRTLRQLICKNESQSVVKMDGGGTVTLQVSNIPPYLREEEFSRFCMSWEGCTGSRLQQTATGLKGVVDFSSTAAAQQACNLYNGWQGWGPRGLSLEILSSNNPQTTPQPTLQPTAGMSGVDATKDAGMGGYQGMMMGGNAQMGVQQAAGLQAQPQVQQQQLAGQQRPMQQQAMLPQQQQGTVMGGGMQTALPYQQNSGLGATPMGNGQNVTGMLGGAAVPAAANSLNVQQLLQQAQTPQQQPQQMFPNTVQPQYAQNNMQSMNQQQLLLAMQNAGGMGAPTPMTGVGVNPMTQHNPMINTPQNQPMTGQMQLPRDAADTLFCEGLPNDTTEREVSHVFRPFDGFKEVRLIQRENKQSEEGKVTLGFFEFKTPACANAALNVIQGYQFDLKNPNFKLKLSFAKYSTKRGQGGSSGGRGGGGKRKHRDD